jgi:hypothetical protein
MSMTENATNFDVKVNVLMVQQAKNGISNVLVNPENLSLKYWQEIQEWLNVRNSVRRKLVRNFHSKR